MPAHIRQLFAKRDDPYADADRASARKYAGLLWILQTAAVVVLAPLAPPSEALGAASGWVALGAFAAGGAAIGWLLLRRGERVGDGALLAFQYLAVAEIAALSFLADEHVYAPIMTLWVVFVPASHPPRRVVGFWLFVAAAGLSVIAYQPGHATAAEVFAWLATWTVLAAVVLLRTADFRGQRLGLAKSGEEALSLALTDPLTGLGNRRAFEEVLRGEVARAERHGTRLALALADLDGFKELNDRLGHITGDKILRRVAETMVMIVRAGDQCFRWGGDEFALLLPHTSHAAAQAGCDRIGELVTATLMVVEELEITLTFGVAEHRPGDPSPDLVATADLELMSRKAEAEFA